MRHLKIAAMLSTSTSALRSFSRSPNRDGGVILATTPRTTIGARPPIGSGLLGSKVPRSGLATSHPTGVTA